MRTYHLVVLGLVALLCGSASVATGSILHQINYQGQLADSLGNPLDTTIAMTFKIYHESTGGTYIWTETHATVNVVGGLFSVALGSGTAIPDSLFLDTTLYLGVTIGGDSELSPRTKLTSSAFSYRIQSIDGATGGTVTGDLSLTGKCTIGSGNSNTGNNSFIAALNDTVNADNSAIVASTGCKIDSAGSFVGAGFEHKVTNIRSAIVGGYHNTVSAKEAFIGGGWGNWVTGEKSGIVGARESIVSGIASYIGGGSVDTVSSSSSAIIGGELSVVSGYNSVVIGSGAKADDAHCVIISANTDYGPTHYYHFNSGGEGQVLIGVGANLHITRDYYSSTWDTANLITTSTGAKLTNGGVWTNSSDRNKKENFASINDEGILQKIADMPITKWNFKAEDPSIKHIGPMAQDFYAAFGLGNDDKTIPSTDADGVALAAIQELYKKTQEIDALKTEINELRGMVQILLGMQNRPANPDADMASSK